MHKPTFHDLPIYPSVDPSTTQRKQSVHVNGRLPRPLSFPPHLRTEWAHGAATRAGEGCSEGVVESGREGDRPRPLTLHSDEIFALRCEIYCGCASACLRNEESRETDGEENP